MKLSSWQQIVLREAARSKPRLHRRLLEQEYKAKHPSAKQKEIVDTITRVMESLIKRGLAVGYGSKTQYKLFLTTLRLTPKGRRVVKDLQTKVQPILPMFKAKKGRNKK